LVKSLAVLAVHCSEALARTLQLHKSHPICRGQNWSLEAVQDGVHEAVFIYFVVLVIIGAFFAVNLALAVLYLHFTQFQAELAVEQEQAAAHKRISMAPSAAERTSFLEDGVSSQALTCQHQFRRICFRIQQNWYFEGLTIVLITLNTITMASVHHGMSNRQIQVRFAMFWKKVFMSKP
jgi:hypothetical protein